MGNTDSVLAMEAMEKKMHEANSYAVIEGRMALEAFGRRVVVREDKFRTGYECKTCDGDGFIDESCGFCKGRGLEVTQDLSGNDMEVSCRVCKGTGKKVCPDCNGKGGLLIAPESSQRRPTTGRVMSVGDECKKLKVGDHVLYGNYAGTLIEFKNKTAVRILGEDEVISKIYSVRGFNMGQVT